MGLSNSQVYYKVCDVLKSTKMQIKYLNMWSLIPDFTIMYVGIQYEHDEDLFVDQEKRKNLLD